MGTQDNQFRLLRDPETTQITLSPSYHFSCLPSCHFLSPSCHFPHPPHTFSTQIGQWGTSALMTES